MRDQAHQTSRDKGFWTAQIDVHDARPDGFEPLDQALVEGEIPKKIMLFVEECVEALRDYREGHMALKIDPDTGKVTGFASELADIIVRVGDLAGALDIDLDAVVQAKMAYNAKRAHMNGGRKC